MVTNCPVCGKKFHVQYPHLWVYREDGVHICTWKCLRKIRREKEEKMAEELKNIEEPTPKKRGRKPKAKEDLAVVKLSGPIKIETPEAERVQVVETPETPEIDPVLLPATYDGMVIREVEGLFGRYRYSGDLGRAEYIDFENADGMETLSLTVDQWRKFREEQIKAALILGVRL